MFLMVLCMLVEMFRRFTLLLTYSIAGNYLFSLDIESKSIYI